MKNMNFNKIMIILFSVIFCADAGYIGYSKVSSMNASSDVQTQSDNTSSTDNSNDTSNTTDNNSSSTDDSSSDSNSDTNNTDSNDSDSSDDTNTQSSDSSNNNFQNIESLKPSEYEVDNNEFEYHWEKNSTNLFHNTGQVENLDLMLEQRGSDNKSVPIMRVWRYSDAEAAKTDMDRINQSSQSEASHREGNIIFILTVNNKIDFEGKDSINSKQTNDLVHLAHNISAINSKMNGLDVVQKYDGDSWSDWYYQDKKYDETHLGTWMVTK